MCGLWNVKHKPVGKGYGFLIRNKPFIEYPQNLGLDSEYVILFCLYFVLHFGVGLFKSVLDLDILRQGV